MSSNNPKQDKISQDKKPLEGKSSFSFKTLSGVWKIRSIPSPAGILLLLLLPVLVVVVLPRTLVFFSGASAQYEPKMVNISNITDRSFVVSWVTESQVTGLVQANVNGSYINYYDVRDSSSPGNYYTHYILVDGRLEPEKEYSFNIISSDKVFKDDVYKVKTAKMLSGPLPEANLAYGQIRSSSGGDVSGAIVILEIPGMSKLSSITSSQGNWVIPLSVSYNYDLTGLAQLPQTRTEEVIKIYGGVYGDATIVNYTDNNTPVPLIILGQTQDLRDETPSPDLFSNGENGGFQAEFPTKVPIRFDFKVNNPEDGEVLYTRRPEFFGTAQMGGNIEITVESEKTFTDSFSVGSEQEWSWTPPDDLEPGEHTLTVRYIAPDGNIETIVRNFIVMAADNDLGPAFTSTPSATVTPTIVVFNTPTQKPSPTILPTSSKLSSTPTPLATQTMPSTQSGVPTTGYSYPKLFIIIGSLMLMAISALVIM